MESSLFATKRTKGIIKYHTKLRGSFEKVEKLRAFGRAIYQNDARVEYWGKSDEEVTKGPLTRKTDAHPLRT